MRPTEKTKDSEDRLVDFPRLWFGLRVTILALGESASPPWWRTRFMNLTGLRFFERLYPRSALSSAVESAMIPARRLHDQAIGKGNLHLFRLDTMLEEELREYSVEMPEEERDALVGVLASRDAALGSLASMAVGGTESAAGALRVCRVSDMRKSAVVGRLATLYLDAFKAEAKVYPYFDMDR